MRRHGVHFQPSLSGALHTARTNAFFMGGGKALVNAYFRSAERLGVQVRYDTPVCDIELQGDRFVAAHVPPREVGGRQLPAERIQARSCVLAAGGFESTAAGCVRPGGRTNAANGRRTTSWCVVPASMTACCCGA